jgi:hypothetical protein
MGEVMLSIAKTYIANYGDNAIEAFIADLMAGDPKTFKAGYTRENAVIAASDAFGIPREELS